MVHTTLIGAHGASGLAALAVGSLALHQPCQGGQTAFRVYLGALWLMVLCLLLVVALDWSTLAGLSRLLFGALLALALYMAWRGRRAGQVLQRREAGRRGGYVEDIGFTLIALFDGFVIIGALDLGVPLWLVVAIGVLGVVVGRSAISRTKRRAIA
jgi:hypothetical protein